MVAVRKNERQAHLVQARVDDDLKQRIETYAAEHGLSLSEAVRSLLAFAVTEAEDPTTRILYATFCELRMQWMHLLKEGMQSGLQAVNTWATDIFNKQIGDV